MKNCDGCEALFYCATVECGCMLRYQNYKKDGEYLHESECPKPLSYEEYKPLRKKVIDSIK